MPLMSYAAYQRPRKIHTYRLTALALLSLLNLAFPQHAAAGEGKLELKPAPDAVCLEAGAVPGAAMSDRLPEVGLRRAKRTVRVLATAYSSTVDQTDGDPFTTASGSRVHAGTIAVNGLAFGTQVRFPDHYGDRIFIVEDRMNARYGPTTVDIWMTTRGEAIRWGKRFIRMEVL